MVSLSNHDPTPRAHPPGTGGQAKLDPRLIRGRTVTVSISKVNGSGRRAGCFPFLGRHRLDREGVDFPLHLLAKDIEHLSIAV